MVVDELTGSGSFVQSAIPAVKSTGTIPERSSSVETSDFQEITPAGTVCVCVCACVSVSKWLREVVKFAYLH